MNRTKRKIFETALTLFAEKGYEATSIEEITAVVGVAKGTLYYHFTSKEEIFKFLIEEGFNLLTNSVIIKTTKATTTEDKLRAIILVQNKIVSKYESFIRMIAGQMWGNEPRNKFCKKQVDKYIYKLEELVEEGIKKGDIKEGNARVIATEIFTLFCTTLIYQLSNRTELISQKENIENILSRYLITKKSETMLNIDKIKVKLKTKYIGKNIIYYKTIDSTQKKAKELHLKNIQNGSVILTDMQTDGIGTHGRKWYADEEKNILMTIVIEPNCNINKLENITTDIAQIIVDIIKKMYKIRLAIKEPNDIMLNDKKLRRNTYRNQSR